MTMPKHVEVKLCDNNIKKKFQKINKKVTGTSISNDLKNDLWSLYDQHLVILNQKASNLKYDQF